MTQPGPGDRYLARLLARPGRRWAIVAAFLLAGAAGFWLRVVRGSAAQALPWYGMVLGAYGLVMIIVSRDLRSRLAYGAFGALVAATFSHALLPARARAVGAVEAVASAVIVVTLLLLGRDERFLAGGAVLQSQAPDAAPPPDPDEISSP
jgi:hypothetical protein